MNNILAVALGGALGSAGRYLVAGQVARWAGLQFPWGTLAVNILGCTIMGVLIEVFALAWSPGGTLRAFLTVGFLGGFTTFSAFAADTGLLFGRNDTVQGLAYVAASVLLSLVGFWLGLKAVRLVVT